MVKVSVSPDTGVRRSSRTRTKAVSVYDEAKKQLDAESEAAESDIMSADESSSSEGEDEERYEPTQKSTTPSKGKKNKGNKKTPPPKSKSKKAKTSKAKLSPKIRVTKSQPKDPFTSPKPKAKQRKTRAPRRTKAVTEMIQLCKPNSILQSLLQNPTHNNIAKMADEFVESYHNDANQATITLFEFVFECIGCFISNEDGQDTSNNNGGEVGSVFPADALVSEMVQEEWEQVITDVVDIMRYTDVKHLFLCATSSSSTSTNTTANSNAVAANKANQETYEHFFEELVTAADRAELSVEEIIGNLCSALIEINGVGQPDVRHAATTAILSIGSSLLTYHSRLQKRVDNAKRQLKACGKQSERHEHLKNVLDKLKRDMEAIYSVFQKSVLDSVFIHRYRDSAESVREACIAKLGNYIHGNLYELLSNKWLKYLGWFLSDDSPSVRLAAVSAITALLNKIEAQSSTTGDNTDLVDAMSPFTKRFTPRMIDLVLDINPAVAEESMRCALALFRGGYLDHMEDDAMWERVNICAIDDGVGVTDEMRKLALYFVFEQLEAFEEEEDPYNTMSQSQSQQKSQQSNNNHTNNNNRSKKDVHSMTLRRLDALASWLAHTLTNGSRAKAATAVHYDLVRFVVVSILAMDEHRYMLEDLEFLLDCLVKEESAKNMDQGATDAGVDVVKSRVLVCMLHYTVQILLPNNNNKDTATTKGTKSTNTNTNSTKILQILPALLTQYSADTLSLSHLSILPTHIHPTVLYLSSNKKHCIKLQNVLCSLYNKVSAGSGGVLGGVSMALAALTRCTAAAGAGGGGGASSGSSSGVGAVSKLLMGCARRICSNEGDDDDEDLEGVALALTQLATLGRRHDIPTLLSQYTATTSTTTSKSKSKSKSNHQSITAESLTTTIYKLLHRIMTNHLQELHQQQQDRDERDEDDEFENSNWKDMDVTLIRIMRQGMDVLYCIMLWLCRDVLEAELSDGADSSSSSDNDSDMEDEDDDENNNDDAKRQTLIENNPSIKSLLDLRTKLFTICAKCYELTHFIVQNDEDDEDGPAAHTTDYNTTIPHTLSVLLHCNAVSSDVRLLFTKALENAKSTTLRAIVLEDADCMVLVRGMAGVFCMVEDDLRINDNQNNNDNDVAMDEHGNNNATANAKLIHSALLPILRPVATNWEQSNRKEAGKMLTHIVNSGPLASNLLSSLSKHAKKTEPARLLETHMASLRGSYSDWIMREPEDPVSNSDADMAAFEAAEAEHQQLMVIMEQQAARYSATLGVGVIKDARVKNAIVGFMREGMRFAFSLDQHRHKSQDKDNEDGYDDLLLGGRLSFLRVLGKYSPWIKRKGGGKKGNNNKNLEDFKLIVEELLQYEKDLRSHADFHEVMDEDLQVLVDFKASLGISSNSNTATNTVEVSNKGSKKRGRAAAPPLNDNNDDDDNNDFDDVDGDDYSQDRRSNANSNAVTPMSAMTNPSIRTSLASTRSGTTHRSNSTGTSNSVSGNSYVTMSTAGTGRRSKLSRATTPRSASSMGSRSRMSMASSVRSSLNSNLSPLVEEDDVSRSSASVASSEASVSIRNSSRSVVDDDSLGESRATRSTSQRESYSTADSRTVNTNASGSTFGTNAVVSRGSSRFSGNKKRKTYSSSRHSTQNTQVTYDASSTRASMSTHAEMSENEESSSSDEEDSAMFERARAAHRASSGRRRSR